MDAQLNRSQNYKIKQLKRIIHQKSSLQIRILAQSTDYKHSFNVLFYMTIDFFAQKRKHSQREETRLQKNHVHSCHSSIFSISKHLVFYKNNLNLPPLF